MPKFRKLFMTIGITLIIFAIGLIGYQVWMVFGTDIAANSNRDNVVASFENNPDNQPTNPEIITVESDKRRYDTPPNQGQYEINEMMGVLHIPSWDNMKVPVVNGTEQNMLDKAYAGRYKSTQLQGEVGNFAVAAHRRSYGSNFRKIDELKNGDSIIMETPTQYIVYKIFEKEIVKPEDTQVLFPVPHEEDTEATKRIITMTTCHSDALGAYGNDKRYVAYGEMEYWIDKSDGTPEELTI